MNKVKYALYAILATLVAVFVYLVIPVNMDTKDIYESYNSLDSTSDDFQSKRQFYTLVESILATADDTVTFDFEDTMPAEYAEVLTKPEDGTDGFWSYVTDGKATSYETASSLGKSYWDNAQESIVVNVWAWNTLKNEKVTKEVVISVNSKFANLFVELFDDIYDSAEQPVINDVYCYSYREKTTGSGLSAHSFGLAVDINVDWNPQYMSTALAPSCGLSDEYSAKGAVITSDMYKYIDVSEEYKRNVLYVDGTIVKYFVEKYTFKWGATFNYSSSNGGGDRMHFSLAGDGSWRDEAVQYYQGKNWADYYLLGTLDEYK